MTKLLDRFLSYVKIDTQSEGNTDCFPSTEKQKHLGEQLVQELKEMGAVDVCMDEYGYVYATIPANSHEQLPVIGFLAHMDTAPAMSGTNVKPRIVERYDGQDVILNQELGIVLSVKDFPDLKKYTGKDLIVTDGTTLLGADDKAGIGEIMTLAEFLLSNPQIQHGTIKIGFTVDEEISCGVEHFDIKRFGADFAYTVDGGELGEIEYENYNAAIARLTIHKPEIPLDSSDKKRKNAILLAMEFQMMLTTDQKTDCIESYEDFYDLEAIQGQTEKTETAYFISDYDGTTFKERKEHFQKTADCLNDTYGQGTFEVHMEDLYYNMREKIKPHMHLVENVKKAMEELGIQPISVKIPGCTDGSRLSYMGLPCPNLCTGGHNCHEKYEYICVQSMEKVVEVLKKIVEEYSRPGRYQ